MKIAIIGAGMAGLSAGLALREAGHQVQLFDKGRGPGGRMSRRREGELEFDHGAQYFTARDPAFLQQVRAWVTEGVVAPWNPAIGECERRILTAKETDQPVRYVGTPGMNEPIRAMVRDLDVTFGCRITSLDRSGEGWTLQADPGCADGTFDAVLVTVPADQAVPLLKPAPALAEQAARIRMLPCWAVMTAFHAPLDVPYDGIFFNSGSLAWAARNSSKPGRPTVEAWVLHGSAAWSMSNIEMPPEYVAQYLLDSFFRNTTLIPVDPVFIKAHRWRYALPEAPLFDGFGFDAETRIGMAGDWCNGARIEGAWLSGRLAANAILRAS